jgi:hypothetical protein
LPPRSKNNLNRQAGTFKGPGFFIGQPVAHGSAALCRRQAGLTGFAGCGERRPVQTAAGALPFKFPFLQLLSSYPTALGFAV